VNPFPDERHLMRVGEVAHLAEGVRVAQEEDGESGTAVERTLHVPEMRDHIYCVKLITRNAQWSKLFVW
jgi:hypothetical protein